MKHYLIFLSLIAICISQANAQEEKTIMRNEIEFTGLWGGTMNDFIKIGDEIDITFGGSLALEINQNFLIGYCIYTSRFKLNEKNDHTLQMYDLLLGYTFNSDKAIHPIAYLRGGAGTVRGPGFIADGIFSLQPSIGLEINIARIFRISSTVGYRSISGVDAVELDNSYLSSPYVDLRLKFGFSWDKNE